MATPFRHPLLKDPPGWLTLALFLSAERYPVRLRKQGDRDPWIAGSPRSEILVTA